MLLRPSTARHPIHHQQPDIPLTRRQGRSQTSGDAASVSNGRDPMLDALRRWAFNVALLFGVASLLTFQFGDHAHRVSFAVLLGLVGLLSCMAGIALRQSDRPR